MQSTVEKLATAIVLNRADWIAAMDYSLAEAVDRVGPQWCAMLLRAPRALDDDDAERAGEPTRAGYAEDQAREP